MRRPLWIVAFIASLLCGLPAQSPPPYIQPGSIRNAASQMPPSLDGGHLAPGMHFGLHGVRLSGSPLRLRFRQDRLSHDARILSSTPTVIEAIVPSGLRPGRAALELTTGLLESNLVELVLTAASPGIYTTDPQGRGTALGASEQITDAGHASATLQVTGLPARTEELSAFIGGQPAPIVSRTALRDGREQLTLRVTREAPLGCQVPVYLRTSSKVVSNSALLAIATPDHPCPPPLLWPTGQAKSGGAYGLLLLMRSTLKLPMVHFTDDEATAIFWRNTESKRPSLRLDLPATGTCVTRTGQYDSQNVASLSPTATLSDLLLQGFPGEPFAFAGQKIAVTGPRGHKSLTPRPRSPGFFGAHLGGDMVSQGAPLFLSPGGYLFHLNRDGAEAVEQPLQVAPLIRWSHVERLQQIDRSHGLDVQWSNAGTGQTIVIVLMNVDRATTDTGVAVCLAEANSGRFHVPADMLRNIPTSYTDSGVPLSLLFLGALPSVTPGEVVPGLDRLYRVTAQVYGQSVQFH